MHTKAEIARKFTEFMIEGQEKAAAGEYSTANSSNPTSLPFSAIKEKLIEGACFSKNGVVEINRDNSDLDSLLIELR